MSDEIEDHGNEIERAFVQSENHEFDGEKLQPYSKGRMIAAQAMQLSFGHVDEAGVAVYNKTKVYPGAVRDVAVVLWLCTLKAEEEVDAAARDPVGSAIKATQFADNHCIASTMEANFWNAYALFFKIMDEIEVARVEAQKKTKMKKSEEKPIAAT